MESMILRNPDPEPEDDATIATAWTVRSHDGRSLPLSHSPASDAACKRVEHEAV